MEINAKQRPNGMYVLSREDLEKLANAVLREFDPQNLEIPRPLDTAGFLRDYLGLLVKEAYIGTLDRGCLGLMVMADYAEIPSLDLMYRPVVLEETRGNVLISRSLLGRENAGRKHYTEVHEGCHWLLHRPYFDRLEGDGLNRCAVCRMVERYGVDKRDARAWMEWQADSLAAALLMPEAVFRDYVRTAIRQAGVPRGYLNEDSPEDRRTFYEIIKDISATFKVSSRAAQIRMIHLKLIHKKAA